MQHIYQYSRCSCSRPWSLILFASCCAFLFSRQILDAYLFFSRGDNDKSDVVPGAALTMDVSCCSSSPSCSKRRGFASASVTDWSLCCLEHFEDARDLAPVTGSWMHDSMCGSEDAARNWAVGGWHFGPFDWTLYSQKYRFCVSYPPLLLLPDVFLHRDGVHAPTVMMQNLQNK